MNDDYDKGWLDGFYKGIDSVSWWESFVVCATLKSGKIYECSYCSDTGINFIIPEMCSPGNYTSSVVKCRRCNGECGPDYEEYLWKTEILPKTM